MPHPPPKWWGEELETGLFVIQVDPTRVHHLIPKAHLTSFQSQNGIITLVIKKQ